MEKLVEKGLVKQICTSNMTIPKMELLLKDAAIKPVQLAEKHGVHPAVICVKWAVQRGQAAIPFSTNHNNYLANLNCTIADPLTEEEMEQIAAIDRNCRLIKGQVFLWEGAHSWHDLWDESEQVGD